MRVPLAGAGVEVSDVLAHRLRQPCCATLGAVGCTRGYQAAPLPALLAGPQHPRTGMGRCLRGLGAGRGSRGLPVQARFWHTAPLHRDDTTPQRSQTPFIEQQTPQQTRDILQTYSDHYTGCGPLCSQARDCGHLFYCAALQRPPCSALHGLHSGTCCRTLPGPRHCWGGNTTEAPLTSGQHPPPATTTPRSLPAQGLLRLGLPWQPARHAAATLRAHVPRDMDPIRGLSPPQGQPSAPHPSDAWSSSPPSLLARAGTSTHRAARHPAPPRADPAASLPNMRRCHPPLHEY